MYDIYIYIYVCIYIYIHTHVSSIILVSSVNNQVQVEPVYCSH